MAGGQPVQVQGAGPIVICCAEADAEKLAAVQKDLEGEGHLVEVVSGVENDTGPLTAVIERCHGEGLYVLCRSKSLGREVVDKCRDILLAQHVPFGRTLTVASIRPRELKDRIRAGIQRVAAGRARRMSHVKPEGSRPISVGGRNTLRGIPALEGPKGGAGSKAKADPLASKARSKPARRGTMLGLPAGDKVSGPADFAKTTPRAEGASKPAATEDDAPSAPARREAAEPSQKAAEPSPEVVVSPGDSFEDEEVTNVNRGQPDRFEHNESTFTGVSPLAESTTVGPAPQPFSVDRTLGGGLQEPFEDTLVGLEPEGDSEGEQAPIMRAPVPSFYEAVQAVQSEQIPVAEQAKAMPQPVRRSDSIGSGELIRPEDLADLDKSDPIPLNPDALKQVGITDKPRTVGLRTGNTAVARVSDIVRSGNTVKTKIADLDEEAVTQPSPKLDPLSRSRLFDARPSSVPVTSPATPAIAGSSGAHRATAVEGHNQKLWIGVALAAVALIVGGVAIGVATSNDETDTTVAKAETPGESAGPTAASETAEDTAEDGASAGDEEPPPEVSPEAQVARSPGLVRTTVMDALRSRNVRSLDVLLVSAKSRGPMSHADAELYCSALNLEDLGGWRLPEIGELSSLMDAEMLGRGYYWSGTAADTFGDVHLAWWGKRWRVVSRDKDSYVTCVRGDRVAQ